MSQARLKTTTPREPPSAASVLYAVLLVTTVAGLSWGTLELSDPSALPIRRVMVAGEFTHLDPAQVQRTVAAEVDAGFFGIDVAALREVLLEEPWIRDATVRRVWPDALQVSIVEQTPVARWGDYGLLNEQADLFVPALDELPSDLVRLNGPLGSEAEVLARYTYVRERLAVLALQPTAVELSARHAWTVTTSGGREIVFGRKDFETRLARFMFGYSRALGEAWPHVGRVDLRYTNGFAVGERPADERSG